MTGLVFPLLLLSAGAPPAAAGGPPAAAAGCPETPVRPGRWQVESVREGEPPARGIADIVRWQGGCVLVERLLLHFDDGSSHHVLFVQGGDPGDGGTRLLQIGDHPLFLLWTPGDEPDVHHVERTGDRGPVSLRFRVRPSGEGFERELSVRRPGDSTWRRSEVISYTPLTAAGDLGSVPPREAGPFHDPDACDGPEFREMDHLLGHWFNEEWVREGDAWSAETVSEVAVREVIGGCALMEDHPVYDDGVLSDRLLLFRGYDPSGGRWRQIVFGHERGVWAWHLEERDDGWMLTPAGGEMEGRLRILERRDDGALEKTIQTRAGDGSWRTERLIRYVPW